MPGLASSKSPRIYAPLRSCLITGMRRFARLIIAFSKNSENHAAMVAIHFLYYNFPRIHKMPRITPAMAAGLSDPVGSPEEITALAG